jgi:PAS domain S-box-containing protein
MVRRDLLGEHCPYRPEKMNDAEKHIEPEVEIAQTHQFGLVFSHATIGIVVTDEQGRIINFNRYAEKQFGYDKDEVLGKKVEILIPTQYHSIHEKDRTYFHDHPLPRQMGAGRDLHAVRKDSTQFPVEISLSPYSFQGKIYVIAFIVDITIRKNSEKIVLQQKDELQQITKEVTKLNMELEQKVEARTKMLQETLSELERSKEELSTALENEKHTNDLKSKFVTLASHEFRTPLSTILSSAFLLEKYNDLPESGQRMRHIQRIKNSVLGLKNILDDFLSVGKLDEGKVKTMEQTISSKNIHDLIHGIIEDMEQLMKPGQHIIFECQSYVTVKADMEILKNIMINLISNAIKFSDAESTINIICSADDQKLSIAVQDQGMGISREDMKHLSERFFRGGNVLNIQGTGLGLHIVRKYLELIQGKMEVESELDKGSTFTINIPRL